MTRWNQYRGGPENDGRRPGLSGPDRIAERWSVDLPAPPRSAPVVDGDAVSVAADDGRVYGVEADAGRHPRPVDASVVPSAAPVALDGRLYLAAADGRVVAVDPSTGERDWAYEAAGPLESAPALADGALVVADADGLAALDAETGAERWRHGTETAVAGAPAVADGRVFAGTAYGAALALDLETGEEEWTVPTGGAVAGGPTVDGDRVYVADDDGTFLALAVDTGQSWFSYSIDGAFTSGATIVGDAAYLGATDEYLHVVETTFGKRKLRGLLFSKNGVSLDAPARGSAVLVGDVLCVGDARGTLYGIRAEDADFLWHRDLGSPPTGTPAVAPGRLYLGLEDGRLVCLEWDRDVREPLESAADP